MTALAAFPTARQDQRAGGPGNAGPGPAVVPGPVPAADQSGAVRGQARAIRSWPLLLLAFPAAAEVWSGWVGIAQKTGFGQVCPLPGIWPSLPLDTSITLPIGVEAYAAYALRAWLAGEPWISPRTRQFAKWSAIFSFALGMAGAAHRRPLSSDLARQTHWHLSGWTGQSRRPGPLLAVSLWLRYTKMSAQAGNLDYYLPLLSSAEVPPMSNRASDFESLRKALSPYAADETPSSVVCHGDSLAMLAKLPDSSVSLILTDPPYHSTKKGNISGDRAFEEDEHFLEWMKSYAEEWKRVLKINGTVYVFCSSEMTARLEVMLSHSLRPINNITWSKPNEPGYDGWKGKMKKESLRQWYPHSERIIMLEQGAYGSLEAYRRSPLGEYLLNRRLASGMSAHKLTELIGAYGKVNHGGAVANWEAGRNIPSREQYRKIKESLEATGKIEPMMDYEDIVRPMQVSGEVEFTDVWDFMSVRPFKGKHPAEKPQDMLMHMISASSYPGDIVLDCFAGSGSTGVAALRLGRRAICMEIEEQWVKRAAEELRNASSEQPYQTPRRQHHMKKDSLSVDRLFE